MTLVKRQNMKSIKTFIVGLILLTSSDTFGQVLNLQTGASISKMDWQLNGLEYNFYNDYIFTPSLLVGLDYLNHKHYNLSSNIGFVQKGGEGFSLLQRINGELIGTNKEKIKFNYFSINTLIDFKLPINERITPFISIGPRFDYLMSYSEQLEGLKNTGNLKIASYGLLLGGGIKYNLSRIQLGIRADYYYNFTPVAEWEPFEHNTGGVVKNNTFTLNLIIGYSLKKSE